MIALTYHDKEGRRYWLEAEVNNDVELGILVGEITVHREKDGRRRDVTRYVPDYEYDRMESAVLDALAEERYNATYN